MAKEYRVPPLLPIWLIGLMVAVLALPVLAFVFILDANKKTIEKLKVDIETVNKQRAEKLAAIEKREAREWERDRYELLVREFNLRFLRNAEEAAKLWEQMVKDFGLIVADTEGRPLRDSKIPNFPQEYVKEFSKQGKHSDLVALMEKLSNVKRRVFQAPAAWVKVKLPRGVNLPPLADAAGSPDNVKPGLYFERDNDASKDQDENIGKVWWLGPGWASFTEDVLKEKQAESPDVRWKQAMQMLRENVGRPSTKDITGSQEPTFDKETGLRRLAKDYPVFFYIEYFQITPSPANVEDRHQLSLRVVFPLTEKTQQ